MLYTSGIRPHNDTEIQYFLLLNQTLWFSTQMFTHFKLCLAHAIHSLKSVIWSVKFVANFFSNFTVMRRIVHFVFWGDNKNVAHDYNLVLRLKG